MDPMAERRKEMAIKNLRAKNLSVVGISPSSRGTSPRGISPRERSGSFASNISSPRGSDTGSPRQQLDSDAKNNLSTDPRDYADYAKQMAKERERALKQNQAMSSGGKRKRESQWQTVDSSDSEDGKKKKKKKKSKDKKHKEKKEKKKDKKKKDKKKKDKKKKDKKKSKDESSPSSSSDSD